MNTMTKPKSFMSLRKKLFSAAAMLLVASIMLVSTSYAWLVLSTAPEVTGITTQVGANGALEIALLNTKSYNDLSKVVEADIDESVATPSGTVTNLAWGNLVGLGSETYGLSQVVLNPSRLNIYKEADDHKINASLLKAPIYNEDGRIIGLNQDGVVSGVYDGNGFPAGEESYGVRAIGVAANMNEAQLGVNAARAALNTNMAMARTAANNILKSKGGALGNIAVKYVSDENATYTSADATTLKELAEGLKVSLDYIDLAVRQVYVAYVSTTLTEGLEEAKATILDVENTSLTTLQTTYSAVTIPAARDGVSGDIIALLEADRATVDTAIADCEVLEAKATISASEILGAMSPLVDYEKMTMGGKTIPEIKEGGMDAFLDSVMNTGLNLSVPTGSGILSDIADFAGNYTAAVTVEEVSYGDISMKNVTANMATVTSVNPVYLTQCYRLMGSFNTEGGGEGGTVITDFYGYAIDLAFRTNVEGSDLQLQTESTQRIYDDSNNAATQGGGSYMEFSSNVGLSASKMVKLMSGVRVVFMDHSQKVLALAALDTALGKDVYTTSFGITTYNVKETVTVGETEVTISADTCTNYKEALTKDEYETLLQPKTTTDSADASKYLLGQDAYELVAGSGMPEGKYAVLNYANPQNSDYITQAEYEALPDESAVRISEDGTIKAQLYLYDFEMVVSQAEHEDDTVTHYTGAIKVNEKLASSAITALEENVAKQVTALVYLDGSVVNNSMVAANSSYSMTGVMNLQFSSSAELVPMNNQKLFDGDGDTPPTEIINPDEEDETPADGGDDEQTGTDPVTDPTTDPENGAEGA